jgi:hypothetical protein
MEGRAKACSFCPTPGLLTAGLATAGAQPALATGDEPAFGTTEVAAGNWMTANGGGVDVYSNGSTSNVTNDYSSPAVGMKWQCVELTQRLYQAKGWHSGYWNLPDSGNPAYDLYTHAADNGLVAHPNDGSYTPVPGDMIIHSPSASNRAGHVAIVDYVSGNKVFVVEQNVATSAELSPGRASYTIGSNGLTRDQSVGLPIRGIVHSPNDKYTNSSGVTPSGHHFVYFVASDGTLRDEHWTGTSWQQDNFGVSVAAGTSPSAYLGASGSQFVYFVASDGTLRDEHWTGTSWQQDNFGVSVAAGTSPSAYLG